MDVFTCKDMCHISNIVSVSNWNRMSSLGFSTIARMALCLSDVR